MAGFVKEQLHQVILEELKNEPPETAMLKGFLKTDETILSKFKGDESGSTAASVYIKNNGDKVELFAANIGDARSVLV